MQLGGNNFGQLGTGTKRSTAIPVKVKGFESEKVARIAAGNHSAAITENNELFIWGTGSFGEFLIPTSMNELGKITTGFVDVSIGGTFGATIDKEGNVYSWGTNTNGELGSGDFEARPLPKPITSLQGKHVFLLACGSSYAIALGQTISAPKFTSPVKESFGYTTAIRPRDDMMKTYSKEPEKKREEIYGGTRKFGSKPTETASKSPMRPSDQIEKLKDELVGAIKSEQAKTQDLNREIKTLEEENENLLRAENGSYLANLSEEPSHRDLIYSKERELSKEKEKDKQMAAELNELLAKNYSLENASKALESQVETLAREKQINQEEHIRLSNVLAQEQAGEKSKINEVLLENEEKIQREIESKHRISNDKEKEINGLRKNISNLRKTAGDVEKEKISLEQYYQDKVKQLENSLDSIRQRIQQEQAVKEELSILCKNKEDNILELRESLGRLSEHKAEISFEIEKCKEEIQHLHSTFLEKQSVLNDAIERNQEICLLIRKKEEEILNIRSITAESEARSSEEVQKLKRELNECTYDNEDMQNHINVKQIEIDKLNKDVLAWGKVADNVRVENTELLKIIDALEERNKKLADSLNKQLSLKEKENKERTIQAIRNSQSPMRIHSIVANKKPFLEGGNVKESKIELKALSSYVDEEQDAGRPLERDDKIKDPYVQDREFIKQFEGETPLKEGQYTTPTKRADVNKEQSEPLADSTKELIGIMRRESPVGASGNLSPDLLPTAKIGVFLENI